MILQFPFLRILSDTSPQIKKRDPQYIEGAESGMIYNTLQKKYLTEIKGYRSYLVHINVNILNGKIEARALVLLLIFIPGDSNILSKTTRDDQRKDRLTNGNYIEDTANHFCLIKSDNGVWSQALIAMKSTQRKKSKRWNSLMLGIKTKGAKGLFTPPSYSHIYSLKTIAESNDLGEWFGWDVSRVGPIEDADLYSQAKAFSASVDAGEVKVKHDDESVDDGEKTPY